MRAVHGSQSPRKPWPLSPIPATLTRQLEPVPWKLRISKPGSEIRQNSDGFALADQRNSGEFLYERPKYNFNGRCRPVTFRNREKNLDS